MMVLSTYATALASLLLLPKLGVNAYIEERASLAISNTLPGNWSYQGCYTEGSGVRALTGATYSNNSVTQEQCIGYCISKNYVFAGVEYASECYCGNNTMGGSALTATPANCNKACAGNSTEACGGSSLLSLFWSGVYVPPTSVNPGPVNWTSQGCFTEGVNGGRALLTGKATTGGSSAMTVALCTTACKGYTYAGVEYAGECFCGNAISNNATIAPEGNLKCNMACNGNSTEFCGGSSRLNVYMIGNVNASAPTNSSSSSSVSSSSSTSISVSSSSSSVAVNTTSSISTITSSSSSSVAVNTTSSIPTITSSSSSSSAMPNTTSSSSSSPSTTNSTSVASSTSSVAQNTTSSASITTSTMSANSTTITSSVAQNTTSSASITSSTMSANSTTITSSTSSNITSSTSLNATSTSMPVNSTTSTTSSMTTPTPTTSSYTYRGCWVDNINGGRILPYQAPDNKTMTVESCVSVCQGMNYTIAGMQYGVQCFCGNQVIRGGYLAAKQTDCNTACGGNSTETCGGGSRDSIWATGNITVLQPPSITNNTGSWQYAGCYVEPSGTRAFKWQVINPSNNTIQACTSQCQAFGYGTAATEYGRECYCGDWADLLNANTAKAADTDCNIVCSGDAQSFCGGGSRLQTYVWKGPDLQTWTYASGNAAGSYTFFQPGVVVPLIVQHGVNGKVTFVEKSGTGPPNSTGAYELDYSMSPSMSAWRTMHVKTDVFCSSGQILPDRSGRQINIGGWSGQSTFGVRLYIPDGSPGVPGKNDWQENYQEISLQVARWYPSSMMMANGSILVVGGEVGSNSAAQPNLEILPKVGPVVYMDWLDRTDPNNLYPFINVLPGGGILAMYYNEARIIDESSFATVRTLPNAPGNVNSFLSGRTYPNEGAAWFLPQHAPYSDPVTFIVCGGSVPGNALATDNCVSIQPEVPSSNWTLERMPSQRVMPCVAALPDGTYLIANGAHHGVAGFGLASDPNFNALLYDPTKPINKRITVMANTTVARLYHSEALLLDDGRILISGSDPQDGKNPEEYRVEIFTPPYLLTGLPRPSITALSSKDWAYGASATLTITSPAGFSGLKISLLAATSSTHGNSFGMRVFFPSFTCDGSSTCTVQAPPNSHVSPPAWFQVFVVDGNGTPSYAKWVRIGGDPASLGNWPTTPSFTRPGIGPV